MTIRILAAICASLAPAAAHAEFSAAEAIEGIDGGGDFSALAEVYLAGNFNGVSWVNSYLENQAGEGLYCPPQDRALGDGEQIVLFRKAVERDPDLADLPAGLVVMLTLQRSFPCE